MTDAEHLAALAAAADEQAAAWERFGPMSQIPPVLPSWRPGEPANLEDIAAFADVWGQRNVKAWSASVGKTRRFLEELWDQGVESIPITSRQYPPQLRGIPHPPLVLHTRRGGPQLSTGVAMVGSREASEQSLQATRVIASAFAEIGIPIITGLARGVDAAAAEATLEAKGTLVGVVPGGPMEVTPKSSESAFAGAARTGCLVAETTGRLPLNKAGFLRRNRVTSGLARVVVITSTGLKGGTVNQLEWAKRQDRPAVVLRDGAPEGFEVHLPRRRLGYDFVDVGNLYTTTVCRWHGPAPTDRGTLAAFQG